MGKIEEAITEVIGSIAEEAVNDVIHNYDLVTIEKVDAAVEAKIENSDAIGAAVTKRAQEFMENEAGIENEVSDYLYSNLSSEVEDAVSNIDLEPHCGDWVDQKIDHKFSETDAMDDMLTAFLEDNADQFGGMVAFVIGAQMECGIPTQCTAKTPKMFGNLLRASVKCLSRFAKVELREMATETREAFHKDIRELQQALSKLSEAGAVWPNKEPWHIGTQSDPIRVILGEEMKAFDREV